MSYSTYSPEINKKIFDKINFFNFIYIDKQNTLSIIDMAIKSIHSFIFSEISHFLDFNLIHDIFIDICIGEYLSILNSCALTHLIVDFDISHSYSLISTDSNLSNIKTIKEGDTSITYFDSSSSSSSSTSLESIINYFLSKKSLLYNFKEITW